MKTSTPPEWIKEKLAPFSVYSAKIQDNEVIIHNENYPDFPMRFTLTGQDKIDKDEFGRAFYDFNVKLNHYAKTAEDLHLKHMLPARQKISLIADASILRELAAPRAVGRTWLDILPITALLPTVDKIYVPAYIADWELRGGFTHITEDGGTVFEQINLQYVDPDNYKSLHVPAVDELLSSASRSILDDHGNRYMVRGDNPHIVIYETALDREFSKGINAINHDGKGNVWNRFQAFKEKMAKKTGKRLFESALQQVVENLPGHSPAYILSNDMAFLNSSERMYTRQGQPVGRAQLSGLIMAEQAARGDEIKNRLEAEYPDIPVPHFTLETVHADIVASNHKRSIAPGNTYPDGASFCIPGAYKTPDGAREAETIYSVFLRGAALERGESLPEPLTASPTRPPKWSTSRHSKQTLPHVGDATSSGRPGRG